MERDLITESQQIYLIVDGAIGFNMLSNLTDEDAVVRPLFPDGVDEELLDVAPHLVSFTDSQAILSKFLDFWGRALAVVVISSSPLDELISHLKRNLYVEDPDGEVCILRYFDPRVLTRMSEVFTPEQGGLFFGEAIERFLFESEGGELSRWENPRKDQP